MDTAADEVFLETRRFPPVDEACLQLGLLKTKGRFNPATQQKLAAPTLKPRAPGEQ